MILKISGFIKKTANFIAIIALMVTLVVSMSNIALANPDVTITVGAGATSVSIDTSSLSAGTYTQITGLKITEGAMGDTAVGTHTFSLPTGWEFDTSKNISISSKSSNSSNMKYADWKMKCKKCSYGWNNRIKKPKCCPNCKSRSWRKK